MKYFLIDYENVGVQGLNGISELTENDSVCIFYSKNANTLTFDLHHKLVNSKAKIFYREVEVGHANALDFQMSSWLGYLIGEDDEKSRDYYLVAKDKGYECLIRYWKKFNVEISQVVNIQKQKTIEKELEEVLNKSDIKTVLEMIKKYKTKLGINNALTKSFKDTKKAGEIYQAIKPFITDKKGK